MLLNITGNSDLRESSSLQWYNIHTSLVKSAISWGIHARGRARAHTQTHTHIHTQTQKNCGEFQKTACASAGRKVREISSWGTAQPRWDKSVIVCRFHCDHFVSVGAQITVYFRIGQNIKYPALPFWVCAIVTAARASMCYYRVSHSLPNPAFFFSNFATNEDIATKFVADLPHYIRNVTTS